MRGITCAHRKRRRLLALAVVLLGSPALAGCVQEGESAFESVSLDEWKARLDATPDAFVLDVRTPSEFGAGHVPGAVNVPYTQIEDRRDELPEDEETPIFVYCRTGNRSTIAAGTLADLGYVNVVNLRPGGFPDWEEAGHPTAP